MKEVRSELRESHGVAPKMSLVPNYHWTRIKLHEVVAAGAMGKVWTAELDGQKAKRAVKGIRCIENL